jgi:nitroimidazol reductase NimA-like FMN-containing flavoprotein (pyridoxamine 5'-phosphate oxidase superfamily)
MEKTMINKKKEVTDKNVIEKILKKAIWCQLAMADGDQPSDCVIIFHIIPI